MKKHFLTLLSAGFVVFGGLLTSCEPKETPSSVTLESVNAETLTAEVTLNVSKLIEYAYIISDSEIAITDPAVIFATGTTGTLIEGSNSIFFTGLEGNKTYHGIVAFKKSADQFFDITLPFSFTTGEYTETYTLVDTYSDGFKLHFKVPASVKEAGHAIRFNVGSLPMYLNSKLGWFSALEADMLLQNGQQHFVNDTTLYYNSDNIYAKDANGEYILDEWSGEPFMLHTPFSPGEPIIFTAGEFAWDDTDFTGWGSGYYTALFDFDAYYESQGGGWAPWSADIDDTELEEDKFWTGFYMRRHFVLDPPTELEAEIEIVKEVGATKGTITITPDENINKYCVLILPDSEYLNMLPMIDNNTDYLQWFTASYPGAMYWGAQTCTGPTQIILEDMYYLEPETQYHLLITALGDENGLSQKFYHETFSTTAKSMPAPTVQVTSIPNPSGTESPYEVWFNVKCTSKNAASAKYAANYYREFGMMLNLGHSYNDVVAQGNIFTADEVEKINSDAGYNVMFSSLPDAQTLLAVVAFNEEDTGNVIDDNSGYAIGTTIKEPAKAKIESRLFADLLGDWTMSANVQKIDYNTGSYVDADPMSCKITITDGITYPSSLDQSVYELYKEAVGMNKDQVDALYEEFKAECEEFNAKLKSQNRLLCYGFGFEDEPYFFKLNTPFDLFVSDSYNGFDNESMIWDCGPKWYIEITGENSACVPVNQNRMYPLSTAGYYQLYLTGIGTKDGEVGYVSVGENGEDAIFPIKLSGTDNASFSIEPFVYDGCSYYLNGMYFYGVSGYTPSYKNVSPLSFTKGWNGNAAGTKSVSDASEAFKAQIRVNAVSGSNFNYFTPAKRKTSIKAMTKYNKVTPKPVNSKEAAKKMSRHYASQK